MAEPDAIFFDGRTARRHEPEIVFEDTALLIVIGQDRPPIRWLYQDLRVVHHHYPQDELALGLSGDENPLLVLRASGIQSQVRVNVPHLFDEQLAQKNKRRPLIWIGGIMGSIAMLVFVIIPALSRIVAPALPTAWEEERAAPYLKVIRSMHSECENPQSREILERIANKLLEGEAYPFPLRIEVRKLGMVNAFALPGGYIILSKELIETASSPEEVVAVLAHEMGHVALRHHAASEIRSGLAAILMAMLTGSDDLVFSLSDTADMLVNLKWSRDDESAADDYAIRFLNKANIRSGGMAMFFDRLDDVRANAAGSSSSDIPDFLKTHPADQARMEKALTSGTGTRAPMTAREWATVRNWCQTPD